MKTSFHYGNCTLCKSRKFRFERRLGKYQLAKCRKCGLVYLNPRPKSEDIFDSYENEKDTEKIIEWYKGYGLRDTQGVKWQRYPLAPLSQAHPLKSLCASDARRDLRRAIADVPA